MRILRRLAMFVVLGAAVMSPAGAIAATIPASEVNSMQSLVGVACAGAGHCYATGLDQNGIAAVLDVTGGNAGAVDEFADVNFQPLAIACPASGACQVVGNTVDDTTGAQAGAIAPVTGGTPGATTEVANSESLGAIGCSSASFCVAAGQDATGAPGSVVISGGQPRALIDFSDAQFDPQAVGCSAGQTCLVSGQDATDAATVGAVAAVTASAQGPVSDSSASTGLPTIACPGSGSGACPAGGAQTTGADSSGNPLSEPIVSAVSGGQVRSTVGYPSESDGFFSAVACSPADACAAVGNDGSGDLIAAPFVNGAAGAAQTLQTDPGIGQIQVAGLACASATACLAVGQDAASAPVLATVPVPAFVSLGGGGAGSGGGTGGGSGGGPGHGKRPAGARIPTRLLTAIFWHQPVRRLLISVRCQTATTRVGIEGMRVRLQTRPRGSHGAWHTARIGTTRRLAAVRGEVRFVVGPPHGAGTEYRAVVAGTPRYRGSTSSVKTFVIT